jgi:hypothetical protein
MKDSAAPVFFVPLGKKTRGQIDSTIEDFNGRKRERGHSKFLGSSSSFSSTMNEQIEKFSFGNNVVE